MAWCVPVVSLQRGGVVDPVEGHLAWGVLLRADVVVVPGPLDWLDGDEPLVVLLAAARTGGPGTVERLVPQSVDVLGATGDPRAAIAFVTLTHPSRHTPSDTGLDAAALAKVLKRTDDLWQALEKIEAVPSDLRDLPVAEVLGPVGQWEITARHDLVTSRQLLDPGDISFKICFWWRCRCAGPWWQQP